MNAPPIVLVPGFWLGAWAWDGVAAALRADGHDVLGGPTDDDSDDDGTASVGAITDPPPDAPAGGAHARTDTKEQS